MTEPISAPPAGAHVILHPTDLSESSQVAFAHALRLATYNKSLLSLLHVCPDDKGTVPWHDYPSVRDTLERWGLLEAGARRSDVTKQLGLRVEKVVGYESNVTNSIVGFVQKRAVDMIVIATEGRIGVPRWIKPSIAEPIAKRANVPTLFVPHGARSCISLEDGHVTLDNVLVPVDWKPRPNEAIARGIRALEAFGSDGATLTLLHVGQSSNAPWPRLPEDRRWKCSCVIRSGQPVEEILRAADELSASLIVLVTEGSQGFLDALRGSTAQQVVRRAPCPVLAIPSDF